MSCNQLWFNACSAVNRFIGSGFNIPFINDDNSFEKPVVKSISFNGSAFAIKRNVSNRF